VKNMTKRTFLHYFVPDVAFKPHWAKWAAMDEDTVWVWFEDEPWFHEELGRWFPSGTCESAWESVRGYVTEGDDVPHWTETKRKYN
jgi:hypothetical protein